MKLSTLLGLFLCAGTSLALSTQMAVAADSAPFDSGQKAAIESIVHDYIINNPKVLLQAGENLQREEQKMQIEKAQTAITKDASDLFKDPESPALGNPDAAITVVEFFDYQCVHCKNSATAITKLLSNNKEVRVVFKQFPIFGPASEFAAKAALASEQQGKFHEFHDALMEVKKRLDQATVLQIAKNIGIDVAKLQNAMRDPVLAKEITDNTKLAADLGVNFTPAFVIAPTKQADRNDKNTFFVPGGLPYDALVKLVSNASPDAK